MTDNTAKKNETFEIQTNTEYMVRYDKSVLCTIDGVERRYAKLNIVKSIGWDTVSSWWTAQRNDFILIDYKKWSEDRWESDEEYGVMITMHKFQTVTSPFGNYHFPTVYMKRDGTAEDEFNLLEIEEYGGVSA